MTESGEKLMAKGPLLIPLAMIINNSKQLDWTLETGLSEQDLQFISKGIFASRWYPRELMEKMALAVFKVVGKNQAESAYQFGYGLMAETLIKIYRSPLITQRPAEILSKFSSFYSGTWFNNGKAEFVEIPGGGVFRIKDEEGIPCQVAFVPMMRGVFTRLVKENFGKNVKATVEEEPLINSQKLFTLTLNMSWE